MAVAAMACLYYFLKSQARVKNDNIICNKRKSNNLLSKKANKNPAHIIILILIVLACTNNGLYALLLMVSD